MTHTHYKGTGKIHSFRGRLIDGEQRKIRIQGPVGAIAWRIVKFQIMGPDANENIESVVKIYREDQTSIDDTINFDDGELLGAAVINQSTNHESSRDRSIIFDNTLFSRNIFVTQKGHDYTPDLNYYIELEEVKVGKAGMAQLSLAASRRMQSDV